MKAVARIVERAERIALDLDFATARAFKQQRRGARVIGYLPVFVPIELITASGMLPLGIVGGGDQVEIIRGDAFFQSYICHLPRSVVELGLSGRLDVCDGFLFPSTCDVIRNLSGIWRLQFPDRYVRYVDVPQNFDPRIGGRWWRRELEQIRRDLGELGDGAASDEALWQAIAAHDDNRRLLRRLYDLRAERPWLAPASEVYLIQRAGLSLPVAEHNDLLRAYLEAAAASDRPLRDHSRVVLCGAFCEQPPLDLLRTLERAGCWIVDDDLLLGPRFLTRPVAEVAADAEDPLDALVQAFLRARPAAAFLYADEREHGRELVRTVRARAAEGVIFAAPSFCDPALLDRPMLKRALDREGIAHISFKYAENTGQFQTIREQAGTFADALKLWAEIDDEAASVPGGTGVSGAPGRERTTS